MTERFVLDAILSPLTREFLTNRFGFDVVDLVSLGIGHLDDLEVVAFAERERRVLITLDLDFGEIFHRHHRSRIGIVLLRLEDTTIESVNRTLVRFFASDISHIDLNQSLVLIEPHRVRVRTS